MLADHALEQVAALEDVQRLPLVHRIVHPIELDLSRARAADR
jgi:hypothetical protein